jgi:hypothetical protein
VSEAPLLRLALPDRREATLLVGPASTVLSVEETDVSSWDLAGRPYALVRQDGTYRRALDGRLLHKREADGGSPRVRRRLSAAEGGPVVETARSEAVSALASLASRPPIESVIPMSYDELGAEGPVVEEARRRLQIVVAQDAGALAADAARFSSVVGPVGILPPDQYLSLVVRGTEGCSWNACTFCGFYRDMPFRRRSPDELRAHVAAVRDYFGESIALRRGVFLGDANALCLGHEHLLPLLQVVAAELPGRPLFSFVDAATGSRKAVDDWRTYARLGLRRVYVGLETGDPDLLAWLGKPGSPADAVDLVRTLHEAGVAVGVIVLLGAGGARYSDGHTARTAEVLGAMRLQGPDLLYFAEFVDDPGLEYGRRADGDPDLEPLPRHGCAAQRQAILLMLRLTAPGTTVRSSTYDIREFVY